MSGAESGLTAQLVAFATGIGFANLPQLAIDRAKASITDAVGCMLAGVHSEESRATYAFALAEGGAPVSRMCGRVARTSPSLAALVNGATGHALDFDDSSPPMIGHPSVVLVATLFALGDRLGSSGKDILTAYVAGLEAGARLGRHMNPSHYNAGWHATVTLGTMAAVTAASKLIGLDARQFNSAIGIAASSAAGIRKNFGSGVKPLHAGFAARNGVVAALLAQSGMTANDASLEGQTGFLDVFGGDQKADASSIRFSLDQELEIIASGIGLKPYPCCGCTHAAIDAALEIRARHKISADDVAAIECAQNSFAPGVLVYHRPDTPSQAKFSMEHCLAVAIADGDCGLDQFAAARVADAKLKDLAARVTTRVDETFEYRNGIYPATVTVIMRSGERLSHHVVEATGQSDRPLSPEQLLRKFSGCAARSLPEAQWRSAFSGLQALEFCNDIRLVTKTLGVDHNG